MLKLCVWFLLKKGVPVTDCRFPDDVNDGFTYIVSTKFFSTLLKIITPIIVMRTVAIML